MVDTRRTLSTVQSILADNNSFQISPQNVRDFLVSVYPDVYNVKNYGAKGDGVTDDATSIQNAINAASVAGGIVYFPSSTYIIGSVLTPKSNVSLVGDGINATYLKLKTSANTNMFKASTGSALSNVLVAALLMDGNGANQTDGAARDDRSGFYLPDGIPSSGNIMFRDVYTTGFRHGASIRVVNVTRLQMSNVMAQSNGIVAAAFSCDGVYAGSCVNAQLLNMQSSGNTDSGIAMDNCSYSHITNADCNSNTSQGFAFGQGSNYIFLSNCSSKSNAYGFTCQKFGGTATNNVYMTNCNAKSNSSEGLRLQDHVGLLWQGGSIASNGVSPQINLISGNSLIYIRDCVGQVTRNQGTATISAATSVVVSHGLSYTPALSDIQITPQSMGAASTFWISTPTSTQFTINVNTSATASFSWRADILQLA